MIIAHSADWEIGNAGERLDPESGLNARMMDRYRCAKFVIEDAIARGAQLILHAGDVWRGSGESAYGCRPTPEQGRLALNALRPALDGDVPIVIIQGNHDMSRSSAEAGALNWLREMKLPGLTIVERPCLLNVWQKEASGECVVWPVDAIGLLGQEGPLATSHIALQLAALPYPNRAQLLTDEEARKLAPGDLNLLIRERMTDIARGLAAQRIAGVPAVLLGHFAVDTAAAGAQNTLGMMMGEWSMSVYELASLGFEAILLGHFHGRQILADQPDPYIAYCGSPEAISFSEEGERKTYSLVSLPGGRQVDVDFIDTPYRRLVTIDLATSIRPTPEQIPGAIVRIKVPQAMANIVPTMRDQLLRDGAYEVRVDQERAETVRRRETGISAESDLVESLDAYLEQHPDLKPMRDELQEMAAEVVRETK